MRTLHVHIGTHKTGTTAIQAFLRAHAEELLACGIYVPTTGTTGPTSGHHNIGWELRGGHPFQPQHGTLEELQAELMQTDAPAAVISSENFEYLVQRPADVERFERAMREVGFEPDYLIFFRDPASYSRSLYDGLHLRHGLKGSYLRFLTRALTRGRVDMSDGRCFYFDFQRFVREWPGANLKIRIYGENQVARFVDAVGAGQLAPLATASPRLNVNKRRRRASLFVHMLFRLRFGDQLATLPVTQSRLSAAPSGDASAA